MYSAWPLKTASGRRIGHSSREVGRRHHLRREASLQTACVVLFTCYDGGRRSDNCLPDWERDGRVKAAKRRAERAQPLRGRTLPNAGRRSDGDQPKKCRPFYLENLAAFVAEMTPTLKL
jgi:hypothetical protein